MAKGDKWHCERCGGDWVQRSGRAYPVRCGKRNCQSSYWDEVRPAQPQGRDSQEPELPDPPDDDDPKETDPLMVEGQR